ncbi:MFS transporter [Paenibacillus glycanilyticus]|uniref:MFS-type transporter YitG n=1 Tax=Paenibacillus glycanilyticus TaxID=126569 RepID=A0ABQ6GE40_9BACL|nr:MFS transporter [Paenibacillus glycanilyticus]GLX69244.1 putative MFS-type transporter YitG [Paenibacillus glycanilyticus]
MAKHKWLQYLAFASVPLVLVLGNSMLVPILPDLAKKMKITELQSSLVITLFSVSAAIFIPLIGYLSDRFRRKAIIIPALAVYGAAGILAGFAAVWGTYWLLVIARVIQGISAAGTAPIAMALVGDMYKDGEESEALGIVEASNGAGKVISPILGASLALIIWYAPFFAFPVFCAAALAAVWFFIKEPESKSEPLKLKQYLSDMKKIFKEKGSWLITSYCTGALGLFLLFGVLVYLSDILEKPPYSIEGVLKGCILAIPLLGLVVTAYLTGHNIKKDGKKMRRFILIGLSLMSAALIGCLFSYWLIYVFIGFITLSSIGTGLLLPCLNTWITGSVDRSHRGIVTSFYNSLRFFGVAAGPPLFSWLADRSVTALFILLVVLAIAALIFAIKLLHPEKTANPAS